MPAANPSLLRAIRGPVTLITLGVLFALNNFTPYGFHQTWPVLLIVFGLLSLAARGPARRTPDAPGIAGGSPGEAQNPAGSYRRSPYPDRNPGDLR